jgi:hypothetical protein
MKIETKYNIGDKVWVYVLDEPYEVVIQGIEYTNYKTSKHILYYVTDYEYDFCNKLCEDSLYPTKEELLKSL